MPNPLHTPKSLFRQMLPGDWLTVIFSSLLIIYLFQALWSQEPAAKIQIRVGNKIHATYDLNQQRNITVHGKLGDAIIHIARGKVRFARSPCHNQYCVHQGWLTHTGQVAICLPNQISLELIGKQKPYDSLNY